MFAIDVSTEGSAVEKSHSLQTTERSAIVPILQTDQLANPDSRIMFEEASRIRLLATVAHSSHGIGTFDTNRFSFCFWEVSHDKETWVLKQSTPTHTAEFGGCHYTIRWERGAGSLSDLMAAKQAEGYSSGKWRAGVNEWGKTGVIVGQMHEMTATLYVGRAFDENASVVVPESEDDLPAIWCFISSPDFTQAIRAIDNSIKVTCNTLVKVPFDSARWSREAAIRYPNGLPSPYCEDETQWLFNGHPNHSTHANQVAIARLLGYRWPAELDPEMRLSDRARELVRSCDELLPFADEDGIVCIPSIRGEDTAAARLTRLLEACNLKPPHKLDDWLRNDFFKEHCDLFQQRPFIWHIWDGRKSDGFHALVNYHKLAGPNGHKLLENLTYSYLGDWINRQESDVKRGESGADGRLAAAKTLQQQLVAILKGEPPYDIFVRWKPLQEQPIGWNPDINDGVRINVRPFMAIDIPGGRKGAGILRWGPKVKWTKDRGKEPKRPRDEYPWFWGWDEQTPDFPGTDTFTGERWNDCHYTREAKEAARKAQG